MAKLKQIGKKARAPANKGRGAPAKQESEKIGYNHLREDQTERMEDLRIERGVPFAVILREAVDFYLQALGNNKKEADTTQ